MVQIADEKLRRRYRILVAPLDWGLGHCTRCIPIIKELLANDCEVWLAGEGIQEALLKSEFPELPFLYLPGYRINYPPKAFTFFWKIISQTPRIISVINKENRLVKKMVSNHGFDAIISDNRFGLYHSNVPCIFITHQLKIKSPLGKWSEKILQWWNYRCINRFSECWVPDVEEENNLAGELSHPEIKPAIAVKYIGPISRFEKKKTEETKGHLLFILSGPETQRTILENRIVNEISHYAGTAAVIRGLPLVLSIIPSTGMIKFYNHLPAEELNEEIQKADFVICRSGYSTLMDVMKLQKRMILIPTPGQTEQKYLAEYFQQNGWAPMIWQKEFSLSLILEKAEKYNYKAAPFFDSKQLQKTVIGLLERLKNKRP